MHWEDYEVELTIVGLVVVRRQVVVLLFPPQRLVMQPESMDVVFIAWAQEAMAYWVVAQGMEVV